MFYSRDILLSRKYGLGTVWLAATLGKKAYYKKLTKRDLIDVNITIACKFIQSPPEPLALRFTSNLLYGIIKIYNRQVQFCYNDCNHMVSQIKNEFLNGNFNSTLLEISEARPAAITLIERENLNFDDQLPLTLTNGSNENSTTLIEFGWIKNYDKSITENVNMKQKKARKNNISLPEISINITDLHERSFTNDQYYDLLLSQEGLLQESLNIFNNNFLDSEKTSVSNIPSNEDKRNENNLEFDLLDIQNNDNNGNKDNDNRDIMTYLENNPQLLNEIKDIISEEKSMENIQINEKGDQLLKELNIAGPLEFAFENNSNNDGVQRNTTKRKLYKFFDQEISLPGYERYYSNESFSKLYDSNHINKRIKLLTNKFRKSIFNDRSKITFYNEFHPKIRSYYSSQHISPDEHFDSNRFLYNTSLQYIKQNMFHDSNTRDTDKFSSIEKLRNPNDDDYDDVNSRLIFSKTILKELQQQQENSKSLTNSFSFNDLNINFNQELVTNMNDDNPFNDLVLPEELTNFDTNDKQNNLFHDNNEFIFNIDQEPEIFRADNNNENKSLDHNDIPVLYENSLDERQFGQSNRSNFPWNITSFMTPVKNNNRSILRSNNSSSTSTRSSIISIGSTNLETPTKRNRRISFGKNIEFSPLSDDSNYSRHNRSIFDNSNEDIVPFPMATKISTLLVGKEDSLRFYNYILDIVEVSNNSFFPDEIQRDDETNPSIFFSDLIPSKTSIKINKEKLEHTFDDEDESDNLLSNIHPSGRDMAVEAFYHVLVLSTNGLIKPVQRETYGDIKLELIKV